MQTAAVTVLSDPQARLMEGATVTANVRHQGESSLTCERICIHLRPSLPHELGELRPATECRPKGSNNIGEDSLHNGAQDALHASFHALHLDAMSDVRPGRADVLRTSGSWHDDSSVDDELHHILHRQQSPACA
jgi:hypothetical protein